MQLLQVLEAFVTFCGMPQMHNCGFYTLFCSVLRLQSVVHFCGSCQPSPIKTGVWEHDAKMCVILQ